MATYGIYIYVFPGDTVKETASSAVSCLFWILISLGGGGGMVSRNIFFTFSHTSESLGFYRPSPSGSIYRSAGVLEIKEKASVSKPTGLEKTPSPHRFNRKGTVEISLAFCHTLSLTESVKLWLGTAPCSWGFHTILSKACLSPLLR